MSGATFTPGADWQDVPDGAVLPGGCHVEMNQPTGRKRARLMPELEPDLDQRARCRDDTRGEHQRLHLATWYAQQGMAVLPLHAPVRQSGILRCSCHRSDCTSPGKHPFGQLVPKGLRDASKDSVLIRSWFEHGWLNVGITTGAVSGIIVLDIDPRHDGDETLAVLEREHGSLPETWRFLTGGGGEHILFRHPGAAVPNSAGKVGPGIDVRGDGGYIVAPPSQHISGRPYAISVDHHPDDVQLADMPEWLLQRLLCRACSNQACREAGFGLAPNRRRGDRGGRAQSNAR